MLLSHSIIVLDYHPIIQYARGKVTTQNIKVNKKESHSNLVRIIRVSPSLQQELDNISRAISHCLR
jgi:hypothetical protein